MQHNTKKKKPENVFKWKMIDSTQCNDIFIHKNNCFVQTEIMNSNGIRTTHTKEK